MIFSGHAATPSTPNAENASSNTGNQLYHGYIITAAVLPAFYALRIFWQMCYSVPDFCGVFQAREVTNVGTQDKLWFSVAAGK